MLILLPPSEGKASSGEGPRLDLGTLTLPELTGARERVMAALADLCSGPEETALETLGISARQADALKRNLDLTTAPTLRAADLYTGVLYDRLGLPDIPDARVLIFSGLWGAVGPADRLPPYRLSMGVKLPPLGGLGAYWRREAAAPLDELTEGRLLVDCRSSAYAAAYAPGNGVAVRVLRERTVDGVAKRTVVSHMAKATRGDIARSLLLEGVDAATPEELVSALRDLGHTVELPERHVLNVVVRD
ncbi:peroxide stress protein YaaA [Nocardiopsis sp. HUAS JQ3]|uniref:peroxide stress protein YaaA n=1 Tax=Nocardiopsis sp. HUAS JQ3 TaxID=3061629 RepID=UPI0023AA0166|nr:peroxide stress protein YaaA [Nocardiopsis sp. HUAS JQ3]WDZ93993.1 peroxide stress protein YaaA [Nocardiopsis sp. HUAS JQ3]